MSENSYISTRKNIIVRREKIENEKGNIIFSESNKVLIGGIVEKEFEYNSEILLEGCYKTRIKVKRHSEIEDYVPIVVPSSLMLNITNRKFKDKYVEVAGVFCSYDKRGKDNRRHLYLYVLVNDINVCEHSEDRKEIENASLIYLDGHICKEPLFRITSLGKEIADIIISINTWENRTHYIPCIIWGKAAIYTRKLKIGDRLKLYGRVQSRKYFKRFSKNSDKGEFRMAYEVSVVKLIKVD